MNKQQFSDEMKKVQVCLLDFLENESYIEEKFENLDSLLIELQIKENKHKLISFLYLISKISQYHIRIPNFISKIEQILKSLSDDIKKNLTNKELFSIFKDNKLILLFLFDEKMIIVDKFIISEITQDQYLKMKYLQYFAPEIEPFVKEPWFEIERIEKYYPQVQINIGNLPKDFYENRKKGENEGEIYKIIQGDLIEEFIIYVNKNNYQLNSILEPSIYETNPMLNKDYNKHYYFLYNQNPEDIKITLIKYAAFFGSTQIFNYLRKNNVQLVQSIWKYAIHGNDAEIIESLKESNVIPDSYLKCYKEAIKCHHNDLANYIENNFLENNESNVVNQCLKYYNFVFLQNNLIDESSIYYLVKNNHYLLLRLLLEDKSIDVNKTRIIFHNFFVNKITNFILQIQFHIHFLNSILK